MRNQKFVASAAACIGIVAVAIAVSTGGHPTSKRFSRGSQPGAGIGTRAPMANREQVLNAYAKLPLTFVENQGQTDERVRYYAQGTRYSFYLTREGVVLSFLDRTNPGPARPAAGDSRASIIPASVSAPAKDMPGARGVALALRFVGSNPQVVVEGEERAPGAVNYLLGNQPSKWHTDLSSYGEVIYRELWPGVDLKLHPQAGTLKYEFHVRPGARPADIRLAYSGADRLTLDDGGGLMIATAMGVLRDSAPVSYQEIGGARVPVQSGYVLDGSKGYGFSIGAGYQPDHELIIDPGVAYSTFLGGAADEIGNGIAVDSAGNAYIVGTTQSPDYPTTAGAFDRTGAASNSLEAFVAKLNPTGTALVYSTFIGGSNFEWGRAIAIDGSGNAYIAGQTKSTDFPTKNAFQRALATPGNCPRCGIDNYDAFVTKLNSTGSALVYSTYLGGGADIDDALGIAVDAAGNAYVTGETGSPDFPVTAGAFQRTKNGVYDVFLTKLNTTGSALVYSTFLGGSQVDYGVKVEVDASNNAYVLGNTSSPDFPTTAGAFDTTQNGGFDVFVLKLNAAGSALVYSTFLGGTGSDSAGGLAIDASGNAYVGGGTSSPEFPTTPGAFQTVSQFGGGGAFVTKLNPAGSGLIYSTFLGDAGVSGVAVTPSGNAWLTGGTNSQVFPTTPDAFQSSAHPNSSGFVSDGFLTELNATGSAILYSTYLGGTDTDIGTDVALDTGGNVYVTGTTRSADFPTTPNALDRVFSGRLDIFWGDAFVTKLALNGSAPPPPPLPTVAAVTTNLEVVGGNSMPVTVSLSSNAQGTGAVVTLSSSNPAVHVPGTLTIPTGTQSLTFTATTSAVSANTPVTITATYNNSSKSASVTVLPVPPPGQLSSIGFFPNNLTGGDTTIGIIGLTNPAGPGGLTVSLSSNNAAVTPPATFTVPAGETTASFNQPTSVVTTQTGLTVFATAGGRTEIGTLFLSPKAPPPPPNFTLTVSATGRSGQTVTSSPAGISVPVGSSRQASFASGTAITLTVSGGRKATWSGACTGSSSSCTLTLNGNASVTANVQ